MAKLLDDTIETVEDHYSPFVKELRERARHIMQIGEGLESGLLDRSILAKRSAKNEQVQ